MIMNIPALKPVLDRIQKAAARDYKQEYADYHGKPSKIKERAPSGTPPGRSWGSSVVIPEKQITRTRYQRAAATASAICER
jgi:hypothetical protein